MLKRFSVVLVGVMSAAAPLWSGCGVQDPREPFDAASATYEEKVVHAVQTGDVEKLEEYLAENPALATAHDRAGKTLLHHAAVGGHVAIAELLLEHSADINAPGVQLETPLDAAIGAEAPNEMIQFLEARGAHD